MESFRIVDVCLYIILLPVLCFLLYGIGKRFLRQIDGLYAIKKTIWNSEGFDWRNLADLRACMEYDYRVVKESISQDRDLGGKSIDLIVSTQRVQRIIWLYNESLANNLLKFIFSIKRIGSYRELLEDYVRCYYSCDRPKFGKCLLSVMMKDKYDRMIVDRYDAIEDISNKILDLDIGDILSEHGILDRIHLKLVEDRSSGILGNGYPNYYNINNRDHIVSLYYEAKYFFEIQSDQTKGFYRKAVIIAIFAFILSFLLVFLCAGMYSYAIAGSAYIFVLYVYTRFQSILIGFLSNPDKNKLIEFKLEAIQMTNLSLVFGFFVLVVEGVFKLLGFDDGLIAFDLFIYGVLALAIAYFINLANAVVGIVEDSIDRYSGE